MVLMNDPPWKWSNIGLQCWTLRPGGGASGDNGMGWSGAQGHLQGFSRLPLHRHFMTIYIFIPLKSRQKRFRCHLDLPSCRIHGFAYILLHLTYFRFCVCGVLKQGLDHLQFSERGILEISPWSPMGMETAVICGVPSFPPAMAWFRRAVRGQ